MQQLFSVSNGTAVCWGTKYDKAFKSHNSYCSKDAVEVYWSSFAVHRDSPLKVNLICEVKYIFNFMNFFFILCQELFQNTTLRIRDSGILHKIFVDELNAPDIIPDPIVRVDQPLNIYQLATAFMVMTGGLTLGILAFMVEFCFFSGKFRKKVDKKVCTITCFMLVPIIIYFPQDMKTAKKANAPKIDGWMPPI